MAYIVNRFNGTQLTVVEDGTIDQTTDIKFVGRNYSGYGEVQNENYLHLLENFSGTSAPVKALDGQVWYDASTTKLKFYTGSAWKTAGGTEVSSSEPVGLNEGDLWWSSTSNQLYGKTGAGEFVLVGPQAAGSGTTQMLSINVLDNAENEKTVIIALINDVAIYIISNEEFNLATLQPDGVPPLTGFGLIKRGMTLVNSQTGQTQNNVGNPITGAENEPIFWGTANDALNLGGIPASSYRRSDQAIEFDDAGFTVGSSPTDNLRIKINAATNDAVFDNKGPQLIFGASQAGESPTPIVSIRNKVGEIKGLYPEADSLYNIGSSTAKFAEVYATSFKGTADKANTVDVGGTARSASTAISADTVAVRTADGDLRARFFDGTAIKAQYADLAEKYTTEEEHPVGTIMAVANPRYHEEKDVSAETRPAKSSDIVIGVVSGKPAYLMNAEADGQALALKGRVPVLCKGPITKGEAVYAWADGYATMTATRGLVGIALETNVSDDIKLVECVLKV